MGVRAWGDGIFPLGWGGGIFPGGWGWHISRALGGCHGAVAGLYTGKLEVMTNYY